MGTKGSTWSDEAKGVLRELWGTSQLSASLIADELYRRCRLRVTRNAVIGQAHRMKLSRPYATVVTKERVDPRPPPGPPRHVPFRLKPVRRPVGGYRLFDLADDMCRWPVGDDPRDMRYCGKRTMVGDYCADHATKLWVQRRTA